MKPLSAPIQQYFYIYYPLPPGVSPFLCPYPLIWSPQPNERTSFTRAYTHCRASFARKTKNYPTLQTPFVIITNSIACYYLSNIFFLRTSRLDTVIILLDRSAIDDPSNVTGYL